MTPQPSDSAATPRAQGDAPHVHQWKFVRTDASWWDGDEEDIYECACGEQQVRYIPR